jgi:DNA-directed RNA polymerase specialized sigma24 family protein
MHLRGEMKLSEIADLQGVSVNTAKSRYRYGLEKLRSILNGQVRK